MVKGYARFPIGTIVAKSRKPTGYAGVATIQQSKNIFLRWHPTALKRTLDKTANRHLPGSGSTGRHYTGSHWKARLWPSWSFLRHVWVWIGMRRRARGVMAGGLDALEGLF